MISTLFKDNPPRTLAWPVVAAPLSRELEGVVPFDNVVVYQLFDSDTRRDLYDPKMIEEDSYPVLAVRRGVPKVNGVKMAELIEADPNMNSILIFPVKLRYKEGAAQAILKHGMRAIKNWFNAGSRSPEAPKPLVLWFNEKTGTVAPRFASVSSEAGATPP